MTTRHRCKECGGFVKGAICPNNQSHHVTSYEVPPRGQGKKHTSTQGAIHELPPLDIGFKPNGMEADNSSKVPDKAPIIPIGNKQLTKDFREIWNLTALAVATVDAPQAQVFKNHAPYLAATEAIFFEKNFPKEWQKSVHNVANLGDYGLLVKTHLDLYNDLLEFHPNLPKEPLKGLWQGLKALFKALWDMLPFKKPLQQEQGVPNEWTAPNIPFDGAQAIDPSQLTPEQRLAIDMQQRAYEQAYRANLKTPPSAIA